MKLLTRDVDYAVRALLCMAKGADKKVTVNELVRQLHIPLPFLRKSLQTLSKGGIVRSSKGLHGGFQLALRPKDIYLSEVMRIFQGPLTLNECVFKKSLCPRRSFCILRKRLVKIEQNMASQLAHISLASLLR